MGALLALFKRGGDDERQNQGSRITEQDRAILVRKENRCLCGKFTIMRTYLDPRPLSSSRETRRVWGPDYIRMQLFCDCEFGAYDQIIQRYKYLNYDPPPLILPRASSLITTVMFVCNGHVTIRVL